MDISGKRRVKSTKDVNNKWQMTQAVIKKSESGKCERIREVFVAPRCTHGERFIKNKKVEQHKLV